MDLVDGDMDVQVVRVGMHRAYPLVLAKAQGFAELRLDFCKRYPVRGYPPHRMK